MADADELYNELIRPIEAQMMRTVARIVHDPDGTADVFQEVLVTIWHKLERICLHPNPHAYILRICVTRSYDALRKRMRQQRREIRMESIQARFWPFGGRGAPPTPAMASVDTFRGALSMLPPKQGQAVLLRAIEGASYEAIASIMECSEATARSHFSKGKARFEKILLNLGGSQ